MKIIEKLGIKTPNEIKIVLDVYVVYDLAGLKRPNISTLNFDEARKLKKILDDKNEMLEALIDMLVDAENIYITTAPLGDERFDDDYGHIVEIIEKANGKKWEEIKEILGELFS